MRTTYSHSVSEILCIVWFSYSWFQYSTLYVNHYIIWCVLNSLSCTSTTIAITLPSQWNNMIMSLLLQYLKKNPLKPVMSSVFFLLYVHVICNFVCHPIGSKRCNMQWERKRNLSRERTGHILSGVTCKPVSRVIWFCKSALQLNDLGHTHA